MRKTTWLLAAALLIAGCGDDGPLSPTSPSPVTQMTQAELAPGYTSASPDEVSFAVPDGLESGGRDFAAVDGLDGLDALEAAKLGYIDVDNGLVPAENRMALNAKGAQTIDLRRIRWKWNAYKNKLIPDDAVDNEGNGSISVRSVDGRLRLVHVWVRGAGTGLAVVDSSSNLAGETLSLGGRIPQYKLALRRSGRFVTNLSRSDVEDLKKRMGSSRRTRDHSTCVLAAETTAVTFTAAGGTGTLLVAPNDDTCNFSNLPEYFKTDATWIMVAGRYTFIQPPGEVVNGTSYTYKATFTIPANTSPDANGLYSARDGQVWGVTEDAHGNLVGLCLPG